MMAVAQDQRWEGPGWVSFVESVALARRQLDRLEAEADAGPTERESALTDRLDRLRSGLPQAIILTREAYATLGQAAEQADSTFKTLTARINQDNEVRATLAFALAQLSQIGHALSLAEDAAATNEPSHG